MRNVIAALVGIAAVCAVSSADAAFIYVSDGPYNSSYGYQSYGVNLSGNTGDTFRVDFKFNMNDLDVPRGGGYTWMGEWGERLSFTSFNLYDSSNTLLATGSLTPFIAIGYDSFPGLAKGESYYFRTEGTFLRGGTASVYAHVYLSPTPVPAALPLFLSALAGVGLMSRRSPS